VRRVLALATGLLFAVSLAGPAAAAAGSSHEHYANHPLRVRPNVSTSPSGLSPTDIKAAYNWGSLGTGAGKTIAIVDAYDDPTAEADLAVFNAALVLPDCTTANGCFQKVNQTGGTKYPRADAGWALEISLDVQWAHAIAPGAKILLVEANSNSFTNLLLAEDWATSHATYVSNSWGGSEFSGETGASYDGHFNRPGISIFVSSGDSGTPASYPSASQYVISVGGTTLRNIGAPTFSETGWSGSGGGCSAYEAATSAQSPFSSVPSVNCGTKRGTPDLSLDADPASGVSVYDSTRYQGQKGWWVVGGTSASSPMIAARAAISGAVVNSSYTYGGSITYRDITSGNNGLSCLPGYDLVTGLGSWTN
jgi:subtilase family serine protease